MTTPMTKPKIKKSTNGSEKDLNGSKAKDPLEELQDIIDEGFDEERTSVSNLQLPPAQSPRLSLRPSLGSGISKIPDTWSMRLIAVVLALAAFGAVLKQLGDL